MRLYERILAGCYEKAEELDDSSGELGLFVEGMFGRWLQARETVDADPDETAAMLLRWSEQDPSGFYSHLEWQVESLTTSERRTIFDLLNARQNSVFRSGGVLTWPRPFDALQYRAASVFMTPQQIFLW